MISAVLFDLDGTLLDLDLDAFLRDYFTALGPALRSLSDGVGPEDIVAAVIAGTEAMSSVHPDATNRDVFDARFRALTGVDLTDAASVEAVDMFYREVFPGLRNSYGPHRGAAEALAAARETGCRVVLATNPIFPRAAIEERARWAGVSLDDFDLVTTYESMHATKPHLSYFLEIAEHIGVPSTRCLMVGDDPQLDMPAHHTGMKTWFVGTHAAHGADWHGSLTELAQSLPRLTAENAG